MDLLLLIASSKEKLSSLSGLLRDLYNNCTLLVCSNDSLLRSRAIDLISSLSEKQFYYLLFNISNNSELQVCEKFSSLILEMVSHTEDESLSKELEITAISIIANLKLTSPEGLNWISTQWNTLYSLISGEPPTSQTQSASSPFSKLGKIISPQRKIIYLNRIIHLLPNLLKNEGGLAILENTPWIPLILHIYLKEKSNLNMREVKLLGTVLRVLSDITQLSHIHTSLPWNDLITSIFLCINKYFKTEIITQSLSAIRKILQFQPHFTQLFSVDIRAVVEKCFGHEEWQVREEAILLIVDIAERMEADGLDEWVWEESKGMLGKVLGLLEDKQEYVRMSVLSGIGRLTASPVGWHRMMKLKGGERFVDDCLELMLRKSPKSPSSAVIVEATKLAIQWLQTPHTSSIALTRLREEPPKDGLPSTPLSPPLPSAPLPSPPLPSPSLPSPPLPFAPLTEDEDWEVRSVACGLVMEIAMQGEQTEWEGWCKVFTKLMQDHNRVVRLEATSSLQTYLKKLQLICKGEAIKHIQSYYKNIHWEELLQLHSAEGTYDEEDSLFPLKPDNTNQFLDCPG
eukprot:TRINITY_DN5337_c0_g1_i4.p1 TRINITY_DN5337_c0_g1~~TRINITY_DN5337_c0_g1_i4.p1  ORF type:complete len:571 (-),score=172.19 TRINITY_DN5337_c0_g1_i4:93-1805(-)